MRNIFRELPLHTSPSPHTNTTHTTMSAFTVSSVALTGKVRAPYTADCIRTAHTGEVFFCQKMLCALSDGNAATRRVARESGIDTASTQILACASQPSLAIGGRKRQGSSAS